ncbi:hypothetical protein [uncultured Desulfuromusa sp.]|uniref:hypothetical protein n=1 Tax=uncultured Desulfuromusa sp. TaxID=219183 RepID=UPI002AA95E1B|nr:hypothetical protein [uncultured Desulfuromusa sp.]
MENQQLEQIEVEKDNFLNDLLSIGRKEGLEGILKQLNSFEYADLEAVEAEIISRFKAAVYYLQHKTKCNAIAVDNASLSALFSLIFDNALIDYQMLQVTVAGGSQHHQYNSMSM